MAANPDQREMHPEVAVGAWAWASGVAETQAHDLVMVPAKSRGGVIVAAILGVVDYGKRPDLSGLFEQFAIEATALAAGNPVPLLTDKNYSELIEPGINAMVTMANEAEANALQLFATVAGVDVCLHANDSPVATFAGGADATAGEVVHVLKFSSPDPAAEVFYFGAAHRHAATQMVTAPLPLPADGSVIDLLVMFNYVVNAYMNWLGISRETWDAWSTYVGRHTTAISSCLFARKKKLDVRYREPTLSFGLRSGQLGYVLQRYILRANLMEKVLPAIIPGNGVVEGPLQLATDALAAMFENGDQGPVVISIGCGPGNDAFGAARVLAGNATYRDALANASFVFVDAFDWTTATDTFPYGIDNKFVLGDVRDPALADALLDGLEPDRPILILASFINVEQARGSTKHESPNKAALTSFWTSFVNSGRVSLIIEMDAKETTFQRQLKEVWSQIDADVFQDNLTVEKPLNRLNLPELRYMWASGGIASLKPKNTPANVAVRYIVPRNVAVPPMQPLDDN